MVVCAVSLAWCRWSLGLEVDIFGRPPFGGPGSHASHGVCAVVSADIRSRIACIVLGDLFL